MLKEFANRAAIGLIVLLQLCSVNTQAADPPHGQSNSIQNFLDKYSAHRDRVLPDISTVEFEDLNAGRVIVKVLDAPNHSREKGGSEVGVLGMKIVEAPRLLVWLALVADSQELDGKFTRAVLSEGPAGLKVRYQHINLPWPIKDRHWVIQVENNVDIANASNGLVWERQWRLHAQGKQLMESAYADGTIVGLTQRLLDKSVYLPTNHGSWTLFDVGQNRTLVAAYVGVTLGGLIPDRLVRSYTKRELRAGLTVLKGMSARAQADYDEESPVHNGWGLPISRDEAVVAELSWKGESVSTHQDTHSRTN